MHWRIHLLISRDKRACHEFHETQPMMGEISGIRGLLLSFKSNACQAEFLAGAIHAATPSL